MLRALFEKTGNAVWMSHLDLMRVFQRAFKRAGLQLTHTQGYNPRPSVSIALPMSVGTSSACELLDFDLDGQKPSCDEMRDRLNAALVSGIQVLEVYEGGAKVKNLAYMDCRVTLEYDRGIDESGIRAVSALFSQPSLLVEKKNKNGISEQDIIPMIRSIGLSQADGNTVYMDARICCQNPSLNPMQLCAAIERYLPELRPDFALCCRKEIYDLEENVFR